MDARGFATSSMMLERNCQAGDARDGGPPSERTAKLSDAAPARSMRPRGRARVASTPQLPTPKGSPRSQAAVGWRYRWNARTRDDWNAPDASMHACAHRRQSRRRFAKNSGDLGHVFLDDARGTWQGSAAYKVGRLTSTSERAVLMTLISTSVPRSDADASASPRGPRTGAAGGRREEEKGAQKLERVGVVDSSVQRAVPLPVQFASAKTARGASGPVSAEMRLHLARWREQSKSSNACAKVFRRIGACANKTHTHGAFGRGHRGTSSATRVDGRRDEISGL